MTADEREAAFQRHLESTANYVAAIRRAGDLPWFQDPEHLAKLEPSYPGISERPGIEARRMFSSRYTRPGPPASLMTDPRKPENYTTTEEISV